jgi:hypothetical protein
VRGASNLEGSTLRPFSYTEEAEAVSLMWFERDGFYFETEEVVEIGSYYSGQPWKIFIPCFHWQK